MLNCIIIHLQAVVEIITNETLTYW
jgi:hypothetical protein